MNESRPLRFNIRAVMMATAFVAVCSLMVSISDWVAALGFVIAGVMAWLARRIWSVTSHRRLSRWLSGALILAASVVGWFSIVDYSRFIETCPNCYEYQYSHEYRVFGLCVYRESLDKCDNTASRLRADLGFPCRHKIERTHLIRDWGLLYAARPFRNGTHGFAIDPEYYTPELSRRIREFAQKDPAKARAVYEQTMEQEDYQAMHDFIAKMKED